MTPWTMILEPPASALADLTAGRLAVNDAANRVVDVATGRFTHALVAPSTLSSSQVAASLQGLGVAANVAAVASVAAVGVAVVGFALVLHRLNRMEGKLDEMLTKLDALQRSVNAIGTQAAALQLARVRQASECLERALAADGERARRELALEARAGFQASKALYADLFDRAQPFHDASFDIATADEMAARVAACAFGELQAELLLGDAGSYRRACHQAARLFHEKCLLDGPRAFRTRCDSAAAGGPADVETFLTTAAELRDNVKLARAKLDFTRRRLLAAEEDAVFLDLLPPHELLRRVAAVEGDELMLLPLPPAR